MSWPPRIAPLFERATGAAVLFAIWALVAWLMGR